jgi:hypothetical protein
MFMPSFAFTEVTKKDLPSFDIQDGSILMVLPDGTGNVYLVADAKKIAGSWQSIKSRLTSDEIVASLKQDELGNLSFEPVADCKASESAKIKRSCQKLVGIDFSKPIGEQKLTVINKAVYFFGKTNVLRGLNQLLVSEIMDNKNKLIAEARQIKPEIETVVEANVIEEVINTNEFPDIVPMDKRTASGSSVS